MYVLNKIILKLQQKQNSSGRMSGVIRSWAVIQETIGLNQQFDLDYGLFQIVNIQNLFIIVTKVVVQSNAAQLPVKPLSHPLNFCAKMILLILGVTIHWCTDASRYFLLWSTNRYVSFKYMYRDMHRITTQVSWYGLYLEKVVSLHSYCGLYNE